MPSLGPTELILILVIVIIFFGVGRLPEVFGGLGRGIREFRRAAKDEEDPLESEQTATTSTTESDTPAAVPEAPNPPEKE